MDLETKKELAHTGVIGAIGFGTSALAGKIAGSRLVPAKYRSEAKSVKALGAIGGSLGLIGDYGAVKLNKKVDKQMNKFASTNNRYLEKIAESYFIQKPDTYGEALSDMVQVSREEHDKYHQDVAEGMKNKYLRYMGIGAGAGSIPGSLIAGPAGALLGAGIGAIGGLVHLDATAKSKAYENLINNHKE